MATRSAARGKGDHVVNDIPRIIMEMLLDIERLFVAHANENRLEEDLRAMQRTHAMHREGLSTTVGTDLLQLVATLRSCREACGAASWDRGEDREAAPQRVLSVKQLQDMEPRSIALLRGGDPEAPGVDLNADLFGVASNRAPVIDAITQWRRYLPRPPADGSAPPTGWVIPLRKMCADMRSCCIDGRALARRAQVDKDGAHGALSRAKAFASHLQNLENVLELAITYLLAHLLGVH